MLLPLACSTVVPSEIALTITSVVVDPATNVAVAGKVATSVLLELKFTERPPAGAAPESVSVTV
jgi:hypothetical protein